MDKEEEKQKIEDLFGPHPLDLKGFSKSVKARFKEATRPHRQSKSSKRKQR